MRFPNEHPRLTLMQFVYALLVHDEGVIGSFEWLASYLMLMVLSFFALCEYIIC